MSQKRKLSEDQSPEGLKVHCERSGNERSKEQAHFQVSNVNDQQLEQESLSDLPRKELHQNYKVEVADFQGRNCDNFQMQSEGVDQSKSGTFAKDLIPEGNSQNGGIAVKTEWDELESDNSDDYLLPELSSDSDFDEKPDLSSQFLLNSEMNALTEEAKIVNNLARFSFEIKSMGLNYQDNVPLSIDYLTNLFFSHEFLTLLVKETNYHATKEIEKCPGTTSTRVRRWVDTDVEEMRVFLGLLLHMGPCSLPSIEHYWSKSILYSMPFFSLVMTARRFQLLLRFWHFADDSMKAKDRLYKVRPLLHHFNAVMRDNYVPKQDLSIDASIILCHGKLFFRQYVKDIQATKYSNGIKLYELRESNGLVLKICCDKTDPLLQRDAHAPGVILHLMEGLLDKGHNLNIDNFYYTYFFNSLALQNYMVTRKTNISHTLNSTQTETSKGDIDLMDQMLGYYSGLNRSISWQKKVALHLFEICIKNAHLLFCEAHKSNIKRLKFRELLVISLIGNKMPRSQMTEPKPFDFHSLETLPPTQKKLRPTRACRVCAALKKRRETRYYCSACEEKPPLCVDECFKIYHNNKLQF